METPSTQHPSYRRLDPSNAFQLNVWAFMKKAGQTCHRFNPAQASLYTGLQCEELAEKLSAISEGCLTSDLRDNLKAMAKCLDNLGDQFKQGMFQGAIGRADHAELIDADCDLAWVSIGALYSTAGDGPSALRHVAYTNHDKFRNGVIKDANGKIQKPADWTPPDFTPFVDTNAKD